jgi:long-chain fatty acid transport protein
MTITRHPLGALGLLACLTLSQSVFATNGYFPHGVGAKSKAMGGAGMANPEDAISIVTNPAVAVFLGDKMGVGLTVFMPNRNITSFGEGSKGEDDTFSIGPQDIDSDSDLYVLPEVAQTRQLKNDSAFGWAVYMRSGIATSFSGGSATFDPDGDGPLGISTLAGTYGEGRTGMKLVQGFLDATWAKKWGEKTAYGISAVLASQSVRAKGTGGLAKYTETFAASDGSVLPDKLTGNRGDFNYGIGVKVGLHREFGEHFSAGIMYQSEINMGTANKYSDLFADRGDIDIPSWLRLGVTWKPNNVLSFSADVQKIFYSDIDALGNSFTNVYDCPTAGMGGTDLSSCLGGKNGPGFGWNDVSVYNVGASWDISEKWTVRAGFGSSDQPTPREENFFNIMMVSLTEAHYTAGFSRRMKKGRELSFSFMYSEEESIEARNQLDPNQNLLLTTDQFDFQVSYTWGN